MMGETRIRIPNDTAHGCRRSGEDEVVGIAGICWFLEEKQRRDEKQRQKTIAYVRDLQDSLLLKQSCDGTQKKFR